MRIIFAVIALFCSLLSRPGLNPHANIENWKCGKMRALYKVLNTVSGRNFFSLFKTPIDLETLLDTFLNMALPI